MPVVVAAPILLCGMHPWHSMGHRGQAMWGAVIMRPALHAMDVTWMGWDKLTGNPEP